MHFRALFRTRFRVYAFPIAAPLLVMLRACEILQADKVVLAVMDRGTGIRCGQREAAKRPFIRLEAARSDVTGSGLGLAIVERAGGGLVAKLILPVG